MSFSAIADAAKKEGCIAALFGHTHVAVNAEENGIRIFNPGSPTYPRDGSDGSYGIITADEDGFDASVVYFGGPAKRPKGGFLRNLMNYSDGF